MTRRNWKQPPHSLRHALELCKDYAKAKRNLSIERIAERMGLDDHWTLYKWLANGRMPAVYIRAYETACDADYVTRWLAISAGKLLIDTPIGRQVDAEDVQALQTLLHAATGAVIEFYAKAKPASAALDAIRSAMEGLAWHRMNIEKHDQPELDFDGAVTDGA